MKTLYVFLLQLFLRTSQKIMHRLGMDTDDGTPPPFPTFCLQLGMTGNYDCVVWELDKIIPLFNSSPCWASQASGPGPATRRGGLAGGSPSSGSALGPSGWPTAAPPAPGCSLAAASLKQIVSVSVEKCAPIQTALQMKGQWESNINVWFPVMYSQKWNCAASLFLKQNYNALSPNSYTHISVRDLYISRIGLLYCSQICGPILGIYKSLTDTWMWKLGLRPRNSQKRNT